ncbi:MadS family sensor histidine kinase [Pseudonocardia hydrocarbonoxydans]|uniref:histidine kinase n=1 Tax=Pseudonocardia hydrocarbonoxydans TaxID=76726 RepID=A0A4Y3WR03_9PSEU|nr:histidine kinase [Pseudonocardia hydrocarbonoxydans]GEC20918.1 histidine kinase [Pseudonocardia hydrocarbonoxydans]
MTASTWPPRRTPPRTRPDLEALTGLRSGKPHYYPEYRVAAERMRRVIHALERISAALIRTMEGSEALVRAVVEAAANHLSAEWVAFAIVDGELPDARPRYLVRGPDGAEWPDLATVPVRIRDHVRHVHDGSVESGEHHHPAEVTRRHLHVPVRLDGRVVGGFIAWTPEEREIDDTDQSVLRILAGQTAAALQNCALHDHSARLYAHATRQADDLKARNDQLVATQAELGAARQREVLDVERHRIARELHDSVTQYALSAGMHIELVRSEIDDERLRGQLDTAKDLTRRAVEQLRSAIYALNERDGCADEDLPSMLRRLSGVHMPDELRVEVRIGGKPLALPADCEQSLFRIAGEALFNTAVHADASRAVVRLAYTCRQVRLTISDDGRGSPDAVRRSLRASVATPSGEHRGLVNMQTRARELGGSLTFRRARLGGLQVQVEVPVPGEGNPS